MTAITRESMATNLAITLDVRQGHIDNVNAGWWDFLGEAYKAFVNGAGNEGDTVEDVPMYMISRKVGLIVTEVAEAIEGHRKSLFDDKLPAYQMEIVEAGDALIRAQDFLGYIIHTEQGHSEASIKSNVIEPLLIVSNGLGIMQTAPEGDSLNGFRAWAHAQVFMLSGVIIEDLHTGNQVYSGALSLVAVLTLYGLALGEIYGHDFLQVVADKRLFNKHRPDHKPEARAAAGGKSY